MGWAKKAPENLSTVRGFTPIVGLAVVVALALAAVIGAMSLANPVAADGHVENLMVTNASTGQVTLQWDGADDDAVGDYSARWYEKSLGGSGIRFTVGSGSAPFLVDISDDDVVTATIGEATGQNALFDGRLYVIEVRSSTGDPAMVEVTPDIRPITGTISITSAEIDSDSPGEVELTWTRATGAADPDNLSNWQYRLTPGTVAMTSAAGVTPVTYGFTVEEGFEAGEDHWMDFDSVSVADPAGTSTPNDGTDDLHKGTITGLASKAYRFEVRARNGDAREATATVLFPPQPILAM